MNIEEHKENLKKYIEEDFAFREPIKNMSDFDKYCYNHCQDIKEVLNELDKKDKQIKELNGRCKNLDKEAQCYLEELAGDSGLKERTVKKLEIIINMMAEYIEELTGSCPNDIYDWKEIDCENVCNDPMKQCWIKYFYNKIEK